MPYIYRSRTYTWNIHGIYRLYTSSGFQMLSLGAAGAAAPAFKFTGIIWNLATPDIRVEGFFNIEAFVIERIFNIE